jgi:hypothetical protein
MYTYVCIYVCMNNVRMHVCIYACTYVHIYVCIYLCMYVCVCVCVCVRATNLLYINKKSYWNPILFLLQNNLLQKIPFTYIQHASYLIVNPN